MSVFEIKKCHLVGEIKDFPMEVVERMVYEQINQKQKPNPTVFAIKKMQHLVQVVFLGLLQKMDMLFGKKL